MQMPIMFTTNKPAELNTVYDCSLIELSRHHSDRKGNLSVAENGVTMPFDIRRIFYIYDVPGGESRGSHAHRKLKQLIVAVSGSFTVTLYDGNVRRSFFLNRPWIGLYVAPGVWSSVEDFSSGAVCMVITSDLYDERDYIRDYNRYLEFRGITPHDDD